MIFPVSGVEVAVWVPPLVAMAISFVTSMGGVSGAFLLLPFQVSMLGFTSPAVTPTNLVFNIVGIPSGIYRYVREGRMAWPLTWNIMLGTLPGVLAGVAIRVRFLPDPRSFKLFVGFVLLYIGSRMLIQILQRSRPEDTAARTAEEKMRSRWAGAKVDKIGSTCDPGIKTVSWSWTETVYEFYGERFRFNTMALFALALVVGIVGGTYGIGGGAIMAPFIVTFFGLPIHTIAGATLMATCVTSVIGVFFYSLVAPYWAPPELAVSPDWPLGLLFGIGGFVGMYLGAAAQKYVRGNIIRALLAILITGLALKYVLGYFM